MSKYIFTAISNNVAIWLANRGTDNAARVNMSRNGHALKESFYTGKLLVLD